MADSQIKSEVAKANPLDDARDAIELLVSKSVRTSMKDGKVVVDVIDINGNPRIKDHNGTPFTVADLVAEIRESRAVALQAGREARNGNQPRQPQRSAGRRGHRTPGSKETWNMTQQMVLENTKPELAKQLKAAGRRQGLTSLPPSTLQRRDLVPRRLLECKSPANASHNLKSEK